MMDAELKAKWVAALRSGEYRQGVGYLNAKDGFCCLGVLCDISGEGQWEADPEVPECKRYLTDDAWNRATLPTKIEKQQRISSHISDLMNMNDGGKSFTEIADFIQTNL